MALKRGDIVLVAEGKPRPAVVIQSDQVPTPGSIIICPLTTFLVDAPIYRPTVEPNAGNGLLVTSQLMVDRISPARETRIDRVIGSLGVADLAQLDITLAIVLNLTG